MDKLKIKVYVNGVNRGHINKFEYECGEFKFSCVYVIGNKIYKGCISHEPNPDLIKFCYYTTLIDLYRSPIYEGDILEYDEFYEGNILVPGGEGDVRWQEDGWVVYNGDEFICCLCDAVKNHNAKVVGNIHEKIE